MNDLFRMRELINLINDADKAYFGDDEPIITDKEYDELSAELSALEEKTSIRFNDSPVNKVGGQLNKSFENVTHTKPMLSCKKTKNIQEFLSFSKERDVVLSWKLDGLTLVLRYENGTFVKAITRGVDGLVGEDVTHTVKEMRNVPMHVPCKEKFEVRGEGVISFEDFNTLCRLGERTTHPRNLAAGAVRSLTPDLGKLYHIDFIAFELIKDEEPDTKIEQLEFLKNNNFKVVDHILMTCDETFDEKETKIGSWTPDGFAYPVDGLVMEYNSILYGRSLGATAHHENRMLALKWKDEVKMTKFLGVTLHTTRTGKVSITGEFEEVDIGGTRIHRANLHNLSNFEKFEFGEGDIISVYKANMIIPQISDNLTRSGTYQLPKYCPGCGEELSVKIQPGGTKDLYCTNSECVSRNASYIARFCDRNAMNINGLSTSTIEQMIAYGWIKNYKDLYNLKIHEESIINTPNFGVERYNAIIADIEASRICTMKGFLTGIGVPMLGTEVAKKLHQYFYGSMEDFEKAIKSGFDFNRIEGVSQSVSKAIHRWYERAFNRNTLHALMAELQFIGIEKPVEGNTNPFLDKNVVVTGTFENLDRQNMINVLESMGAIVGSTVAKDTDFLIYGNLPGSTKVGAALEFGVTMISEQKFAKMLVNEG